MYDIIVLTEAQYVTPKEKNWYVDQVLLENRLIKESLESEGLTVGIKDWADPEFDWGKTSAILFRTIWDYHLRFPEFDKWLSEVQQKTRLINTSDIIRWNLDKHYLKDMESRGVNIAPTVFLKKGQKVTLGKLFNDNKWEVAIIKPCVSGAARGTYKITQNEISKFEGAFRELLEQEDMMFQEFQYGIEAHGEISLMVFGGKFTHAVLKKAKAGDFRVQDDHGGTVEEYHPSKEEIAFAQSVIEKCPFDPVYARVDIVVDNQGGLSVGELELIEPELWFRNYPESANVLGKEIKERFFLETSQTS